MFTNIEYDSKIISDPEHELILAMASKNLNEFNQRTGENFEISYNSEKKEFKRVSHDTRYGHYFDDYCLATINWFISMRHYHEIQKWIDQKIYANRMFNHFENRKLTFDNEPQLFITIFKNFMPFTNYLTFSQADEIRNQLNEYCEIAKSYI